MRTPARILRGDQEKEKRGEARPARRPGIPGRPRAGGVQFIKDTYAELKKVVWPTREQTSNLTVLVIIFSSAVGLLLGLIDWIFTQVMERYLVPGI